MICTYDKKCLTFLCNISANIKYKNYCLYCFINLFPNEKNV